MTRMAASVFQIVLIAAVFPGCSRQDRTVALPSPVSQAADPVETSAGDATLWGPDARELALAEQAEEVRQGLTDQIWVTVDPVVDQELECLVGLRGLRELLIDRSNITDAGLVHLAGLTELEHLRIREAAISDAGLERLLGLRKLRVLNLPQAAFTDAGLKQLASLPALQQLRFSSPHVSDAGLEHICRYPAILRLHLINTPITDQTLDHLGSLTQLESLYLDGTDVTEAGLERLIVAMPQLHLHINQQHLDSDPRKLNHEH